MNLQTIFRNSRVLHSDQLAKLPTVTGNIWFKQLHPSVVRQRLSSNNLFLLGNNVWTRDIGMATLTNSCEATDNSFPLTKRIVEPFSERAESSNVYRKWSRMLSVLKSIHGIFSTGTSWQWTSVRVTQTINISYHKEIYITLTLWESSLPPLLILASSHLFGAVSPGRFCQKIMFWVIRC